MQTSYIALGYIQTYCEDSNVWEVACFEKQLCFIPTLVLKSVSNYPAACANCIGHSYFKWTYVHIIDDSFDSGPFWSPTIIQEQAKLTSKKKQLNQFFSSLSPCMIRTFILCNHWLFFTVSSFSLWADVCCCFKYSLFLIDVAL